MCPACWATLLASYGVLLAASAVTIVGTDRFALPLAAALAAMWWLHTRGDTPMPWWAFAIVGGLLVFRVADLLVRRRSQLLVTRAWRLAASFAATRCPTKAARG